MTYLETLSAVSIRRLFALRAHWRNGPIARRECRAWIRILRDARRKQ